SEKSEKKSRSWRGGDPLAGGDEVPTERVAYLEEVKKRRAHEAESGEAASSEQTGAESAERAPRPVVAARPAAEDFAVQESAIPAETDAQPVEAQAAESRGEAPSMFDAPTVEIAAAEIPSSETPA